MATDQHSQTDDRIDTSDGDSEQPAAETANGASTAPLTDVDYVPVTALLAEERTVPFLGLTDAAATLSRDTQPVSPELRCGDSDPVSLKEVISVLPRASSGELWATNEFVGMVVVDDRTDPDAVAREWRLPAAVVIREQRLSSCADDIAPPPSEFGIELPAPLLVGAYASGSRYPLIPWSDGLVCACPYKQDKPWREVRRRHGLTA